MDGPLKGSNPWDHSPHIISRKEMYLGPNNIVTTYEVTLNGELKYSDPTYEKAANYCKQHTLS